MFQSLWPLTTRNSDGLCLHKDQSDQVKKLKRPLTKDASLGYIKCCSLWWQPTCCLGNYRQEPRECNAKQAQFIARLSYGFGPENYKCSYLTNKSFPEFVLFAIEGKLQVVHSPKRKIQSFDI